MTRVMCFMLAFIALAGCEREQRRYNTPPNTASGAGTAQMGTLHAGPSASAASAAHDAAGTASASLPSPTNTALMLPNSKNPHEENAVAVAEGKRLYRWYNCNGCHAAGGGAIGPALMDDKWIYGHQPEQIVATILQGRPNGMPSFAGRIPEDQVWKIAAYVRSMSGQLRSDIAPSRGDALSSGPPEQRRDKEHPKSAGDSK